MCSRLKSRQGRASSAVTFDPDRVLYTAFAVYGTPSGVLLDSEGRVGSEMAAGLDAKAPATCGCWPQRGPLTCALRPR